MKNFNRIVKAMIFRASRKYSVGLEPSFLMTYYKSADKRRASDIAQDIIKSVGLPLCKELQYDPVIAKRLDLLVHFWRFVAFSVKCEDEDIFRVARARYIDLIQNKYFS